VNASVHKQTLRAGADTRRRQPSRRERQGAHVLRDRPLRAVLGEQLYRALLPLAEHRGLLPGAGLPRARQLRLSLAALPGTLRCERRATAPPLV